MSAYAWEQESPRDWRVVQWPVDLRVYEHRRRNRPSLFKWSAYTFGGLVPGWGLHAWGEVASLEEAQAAAEAAVRIRR